MGFEGFSYVVTRYTCDSLAYNEVDYFVGFIVGRPCLLG